MLPLQYITIADPADPAKSREIAYYEWGDAANTKILVCVHGLSRNARDFDFPAQALAPRYRVISIDMAGRGKSDWLTNKADYNYATYITDTLAVFKQLGLSNVAFLGTSMGGIIGMMLTAGQPQLVTRLILNDVGKIVSAVGLKRILGYVGTSSVFASKDEAMAHLKSILKPFGITTEEQWQHMFAISFNSLADGKYSLAYDPGITQPFREAASKNDVIADVDLTAVWDQIHCPALILRGQLSDILTHETAQAMCERAAATSLVEFAGVGHAPALLDPTQVQIIADWLDNKHEARNALTHE